MLSCFPRNSGHTADDWCQAGYAWDDPVQKRNWGETVHPNEHAIWVFGPEPHADVAYKEIAIGLGCFFGFAGLVYLFAKTVAPMDPHVRSRLLSGDM